MRMVGNKEEHTMKEGFRLIGTAIIERRKKDGTVIDSQKLKNLIVNTGKERVAKLLGDLESGISGFSSIGIGTGTTGALVTDSGLETEVSRNLATNAYEADYKATFEYNFGFSSGESHSITEAGVFDSPVESGSTMLDRFVFTAKEVDADTDLYVKITITVS